MMLFATVWLLAMGSMAAKKCTLVSKSPRGTILLDAPAATVGTTTSRANCYDQPQHGMVDPARDPAADPGDFDDGPDASYTLNLKDDTRVTVSTCHGQTSFWTAVYIYSEDGEVPIAGPGRRLWSDLRCKAVTPPYHARKLNAQLSAGSYRIVVDSAFDWNNGTFGITVVTADEDEDEEGSVLPPLFKETDHGEAEARDDDVIADGVEVVATSIAVNDEL